MRKIPEILEKDEQEQLLEVFNTRYPTALRNKVMIKLMLNTGLRLSEAINLKWKDINLQTGKLKVVEGKGAKDRIVWVNDCALNLLREWRERQYEEVKKRDPQTEKITCMFTTLQGRSLKPANVRQMVYKYSAKAGIDKQISPHTFRHTFATDLYRATNNLRQVQKALGHSDISTTQIYTHIIDSELEEAIKSFRD